MGDDYIASVRGSINGSRMQVKLIDAYTHETFFKRNVAVGDHKAIKKLQKDLKTAYGVNF